MSRISVQSAKAKGRGLQAKVRDCVLALFPHLEPDDCRSTSMGAGGEDVQLSPAARSVFPYSIECKRKARLTAWTDYQQAQRHGPHEPLLVVQADRGTPLAIVSLEHFLGLVGRIADLESEPERLSVPEVLIDLRNGGDQ